ncbi:MAG: integral rane sensor signal transduction histidine kinase, partial [Geobacteraceae bacterium]|nr:integral rane sensor signal transduction histidine kinase [Geobacteraceae bacterium]
IRRLLAATERIAAGDLPHRVSVPGSAEIAALADSFNKMVESLKKKQNDIQCHVQTLESVNRELQTARQETMRTERMASVGLLAAGTAHEIGTPLAAVMGYTGILLDELQDDAVKSDYLKRIESELERIDRIVRGLLDYARPTPSVFNNVDVVEVLTSTLEMLEEQGALKKIHKSVTILNDLAHVRVDRHQLQQVFTNLFINARDAMPEGGTLSIKAGMEKYLGNPEEVSCKTPGVIMGRRKNDFRGAFNAFFSPENILVKIEISDNGSGIDADCLERIFDPFFTTKEPGHGTGLGLAISARIMDSFNGRITVVSEKFKGSKFTVWLPGIAG